MPANIEFVGYDGVQHVADKRPFAGIIRAVSGLSADAVHQTMVDAGLSSKNGSTDPRNIGRMRLQGHYGGFALIEPLGLDGGTSPEEVLERVDEEFAAGRAVALAHKLSMSPRARKHHWTLLTGHYPHNGERGALHAIDPSRDHANYLGPHTVGNLVERSVDSEGVYAYALSGGLVRQRLAVVYAFDREPEPIADTYSTTKQDQPVEHATPDAPA